MGDYYWKINGKYHCSRCGFKADSYYSIQTHILPHKEFDKRMGKRIQQKLPVIL